jgi:hypothetical protein
MTGTIFRYIIVLVAVIVVLRILHEATASKAIEKSSQPGEVTVENQEVIELEVGSEDYQQAAADIQGKENQDESTNNE